MHGPMNVKFVNTSLNENVSLPSCTLLTFIIWLKSGSKSYTDNPFEENIPGIIQLISSNKDGGTRIQIWLNKLYLYKPVRSTTMYAISLITSALLGTEEETVPSWWKS